MSQLWNGCKEFLWAREGKQLHEEKEEISVGTNKLSYSLALQGCWLILKNVLNF